ncbi:MAG: hypothetical protein COA49_08065 [Bacteroidetes bacterium]|nr:MAG: hypothetical protein COA49_08065 [Bacteroidota bacterium]
MNPLIRSIGILVITWLLQVVLFRFGVFYGGWMVICFNIYGLILLPVDLHKTIYLIIGALMGVFMDIVLLTGGLHMAAGAFTGLLIPFIMRVLTPRDGFARKQSISVLQVGWGRFLTLSFLITFVYMFALFAVEGWRWGLIPRALGKALFSSILNLILFAITQGLFGAKPKSKGPEISSFPWS